jgi:predicted RNase H-like HicB family nuclease
MKITVPCKTTYSEEDACWHVESPGFYNGILTYGTTLEEAKDMATEAVSGLIESHLDHGDIFHIPAMSQEADFYAIPLDPGPQTPP